MLNKNLKLKVCGMKYASNIAAVAELQPDYLGFIFYNRSSRYINEVSAELIKYIPAGIKTIGVFVDEELSTLKKILQLHQLSAVQLHGKEPADYCSDLKTSFPNIEIIKAFGVDEQFEFELLENYKDTVDFFLFDTKTAGHGGSGKTFNWQILSGYTYSKPYFLSGGIDLEHTGLIKELKDERLFALDINSRFEIEPGLKDTEKIKAFIGEFK